MMNNKSLNGKIFFNYSVKNLNWFNIGGSTKIYFKPDNLQDLIEFLKYIVNLLC